MTGTESERLQAGVEGPLENMCSHQQSAVLHFSKSFHVYYLILPFEQVVKSGVVL